VQHWPSATSERPIGKESHRRHLKYRPKDRIYGEISLKTRCASENGARFFGMEKLGMHAVGRKATFLITRGTAQQLPRKFSYLEGIYVDGLPSLVYRKNPIKMT
jgi:cytosine/adenosine deaminase-related metal-dependent hydrolase